MKQILLSIFTIIIFCSANAQSTIKVDTSQRNARQPIHTQFAYNAIELKQNFPNPFNKTTRIEFTVPESNMVEFKVYDMLGHQITSKYIDCQSGNNFVILERENMHPGFYFYSIQYGNQIVTKRLMIKD